MSKEAFDELRRQHIRRFMALPAAERLDWALRGGREMRDALTSERAQIGEQMRHGGKRCQRRLGEVIAPIAGR